MNGLEDFVNIFREELIDSQLSDQSLFKTHERWSSLTSLIIITEIEGKFGVFVDIDTLKSSETIRDLYDGAIMVNQK